MLGNLGIALFIHSRRADGGRRWNSLHCLRRFYFSFIISLCARANAPKQVEWIRRRRTVCVCFSFFKIHFLSSDFRTKNDEKNETITRWMDERNQLSSLGDRTNGDDDDHCASLRKFKFGNGNRCFVVRRDAHLKYLPLARSAQWNRIRRIFTWVFCAFCTLWPLRKTDWQLLKISDNSRASVQPFTQLISAATTTARSHELISSVRHFFFALFLSICAHFTLVIIRCGVVCLLCVACLCLVAVCQWQKWNTKTKETERN